MRKSFEIKFGEKNIRGSFGKNALRFQFSLYRGTDCPAAVLYILTDFIIVSIIKTLSRMEFVSSHQKEVPEARRGCDGGVLCGSLVPVVCVPMQLCRLAVCNKCHTDCVKCQTTKGRNDEERNDDPVSSSSEKNSTAKESHDRGREHSNAIRCQYHHTLRTMEFETNIPRTSDLCGGQQFVELEGRNVILCPKIITPICIHEKEGANKCRRHQKLKENEEDERETSEVNFNYDGHEAGASSHSQRRLSSDSGRRSLSESGDSVFSDAQGVEHSESTKNASGRKAIPSTLTKLVAPSQSIMSRSLSSNLDDVTPPEENQTKSASPGIRSRRTDVICECLGASESSKKYRVRNSSRQSDWQLSPPKIYPSTSRYSANRAMSVSLFEQADEEDYSADSRRSWQSKKATMISNNPRRFERNQSLSLEAIMSGEWSRRRGKMAHSGTKLGCLEEDEISSVSNDSDDGNKKFRPRSYSLSVNSSYAEKKSSRIGNLPGMKSQLSQSPTDIDFSKLTYLIDAWEIKGETPGKESIKCYGLTSVPHHDGFAMTDAEKVKIKVYGLNGELKAAFGTPTWPRHGRGITLNPDGKHITVCHLSEVCVYTLDGVCKDRIAHEEFTSCWGVALSPNGNYVISDPKSSSIFVMNLNGELIKRIGGNEKHTRKPSKPTSSLGWRKSKSDKSLSGKKTKYASQTANRSRRSSNPCPAETSLVSDGISAPISKKVARLLTPRYVAINSKNQIIVTDTRQRRLMVLEEDGSLLYTVGGGRMGCQKCCLTENTATERRRTSMLRMASHSESEIWESGSKQAGMTRSATADIPLGTENGSATTANTTPVKSLENVEHSVSSTKDIGDRSSYLGKYNTGHISSSLEEISVLDRQEKSPCKSNSKFNEFVKRLRKLSLLSKGNRRKSDNKNFQISRKESSTSLSLFNGLSEPVARTDFDTFDDGVLSLSPTSPQTATKTTSFTTCCLEDGCENSPRYDSGFSGGSYDFQSVETLDNDAEYYEWRDTLTEKDFEEDEDSKACRSCHVEDPRGVCVDKNDNILLVDRARNRVSVFNPNGHFVRHLITSEDGLDAPMAISILQENCIAVTDSSPCVKIFRFFQQ